MTDAPKTTTPAIVIEWLGGNCPVQAEGTINGQPFYFRARGDSWSLEVGKPGASDYVSAEWETVWEHAEWFGQWPDAGWMAPEQAEGFLRQAAARYAEGASGSKLEDVPERLSASVARFQEMFGER